MLTLEEKIVIPRSTQSLSETLLTIAVIVAKALDGHIDRLQVMLKLKIDGSFGSRKLDFDVVFLPWNLIDLSNVLIRKS